MPGYEYCRKWGRPRYRDFLDRQGNYSMPIDQLRIDNWPEAPGTDTSNAISVNSPYLD
jgi:hypothetical protein